MDVQMDACEYECGPQTTNMAKRSFLRDIGVLMVDPFYFLVLRRMTHAMICFFDIF